MKRNYNKELRILKIFNPFISKTLIPIFDFFLSMSIKNLKNDKELTVSKFKVKSFDDYEVKVYGFFPREKTDKSIIYFHGGAFYMKGSPYQYNLVRKYAKEANINAFFVDYRLSPKHKYPVPVLDALAVYKWLISKKEEFGIDPYKIGVGGDSAGGSIATSLSIKIKEENLIMPKFQMLIYPVLDDKMNTNSMKEFWNTPMWNGRLNKQMWEYYLADVPYKSPFENVVNVPTYVEVTEYDCLRDEGINYYNLLRENNIQAFLNETKGTMHGYDILYKTQIAKENIKKRIDFISSIFK